MVSCGEGSSGPDGSRNGVAFHAIRNEGLCLLYFVLFCILFLGPHCCKCCKFGPNCCKCCKWCGRCGPCVSSPVNLGRHLQHPATRHRTLTHTHVCTAVITAEAGVKAVGVRMTLGPTLGGPA